MLRVPKMERSFLPEAPLLVKPKAKEHHRERNGLGCETRDCYHRPASLRFPCILPGLSEMNRDRTLRCRSWWEAFSLWLLLVAGCDSGGDSLIAVRGRVAYHGTALTAGTIVFTPDTQRGAAGPIARGDIQADGSYQVWTDEKPGAAAGFYRVTVLAVESSGFGPTDTTRVPRSLLPDKYRDPELSGLACEVKASQENHIDFDLE
jgi:hypothetical protein